MTFISIGREDKEDINAKSHRSDEAKATANSAKLIANYKDLKVSNVCGSTAGAGSGTFHKYRQCKRREQSRLHRMKIDAKHKEANEKMQNRKRKNDSELDRKSKKRRIQRQKQKERRKRAKERTEDISTIAVIDNKVNEKKEELNANAFQSQNINNAEIDGGHQQINEKSKENPNQSGIKCNVNGNDVQFESSENVNKIGNEINSSANKNENKNEFENDDECELESNFDVRSRKSLILEAVNAFHLEFDANEDSDI